jgi:hypothetical protein
LSAFVILPGVEEAAMTLADVLRFFLFIALGFLALVTFLVAATIVGLMWVDGSACNCVHYPVGLYVLGLLWLLLLGTMIGEGFDAPPVFEKLAENQREAMIVTAIAVIVILLLLF